MVDLPAGVLARRDPETHAYVLGPYSIPAMPGAFNFTTGEVSKRAMARSGTLAERKQAEQDGELIVGMQWTLTPDNPSVTDWTARPEYWTGSYWDDPMRQRRGLFVNRVEYFNGDVSGINGNLRTSVMQATWKDAPGGQYRIDFSFSLDGPEQPKRADEGVTQTKTPTNDMVIAIEANQKSLRPDYVDDIGPITRNYTPFGLYDHAGGDLRAEAFVFINGTTGTLYTAGTSVLFQYLGPFLNG